MQSGQGGLICIKGTREVPQGFYRDGLCDESAYIAYRSSGRDYANQARVY